MKLDISAIPEGGLHRDLRFDFRNEGAVRPFAVSASITVVRIGERVLVEGDIKSDVELSCSRCLAEFRYPIDVHFRDEVTPLAESPYEAERELAREELDSSYYSGTEIDLAELIREQVLLSLPMKPLCREECGGICPDCGRLMVGETCHCKREETDPRLEPLKKLQEKMRLRKE